MGLSQLLIHLFLASSIFLSATAQAEVLTLSQAITQALKTSPDLKVSRMQAESAGHRASQALAPAEPSLSLTYNDMNTPYHGIEGQASRVYSITQPINFPGKAFLNESSLSHQAQALDAQAKAQELQVSLNVKTAYYQLEIARENLRLNGEQHAFYDRIFATAKRRYEAGAITQVDLLNAEVALRSNDNDLSDLQAADRQARAQLNLLIAAPIDRNYDVEPMKVSQIKSLDLTDLQNRMVDNRNELKAARHQLEASNKSYRLAQMSLLPDFQLSAGTTFYDFNGASPLGSSDAHTYFVGLEATIPLWFVFDQRLGIEAASSDRAAAEANFQSILNQSKMALETAFDTYQSNSEKIRNFEEHILPLTDQSLNLAIVNYGAGKIDFQTLADAATARRTTRQTYLTTLMNFLTAYSNIGQLIGEDL